MRAVFFALFLAPCFAGRRAVFFRAAFFGAFFAVFLAAFFGDFFAAFRAAFFGDFFVVFLAVFFGDFFVAFFAVFRAGLVPPEVRRAAPPPPMPAAAIPAVEPAPASIPMSESFIHPLSPKPDAGVAGIGAGSLDIGVSSIHPALCQPDSLSSRWDIGAPRRLRGTDRRWSRGARDAAALDPSSPNLHSFIGSARRKHLQPAAVFTIIGAVASIRARSLTSKVLPMLVRPIDLGRRAPFKSLSHNALSVRRRPAAGAALGLLLAVAPRLPGQAVAEVQVTPASVTVGVGQKQTLFVAAFDRQGNVLPTARFTFASSDSTIARVNGDGVVVGLRAGLAKVEARAQDQRAAVAVFVTAPAGAQPAPAAAAADPGAADPGAADHAAAGADGTLRFDPPALVLLPGESQRVTAHPTGGDGMGAVPIAWRSLRPSVVTVGPDGTLTGVAAGEATVRASGRGGLAATLAVSVVPAEFALSTTRMVHGPDALDTVHATVPAQGGRAVGGGLAWRSADSAVARVGPGGIVQTLAPGETDIIASGFGQEQRVHVVVHARPEILLLSPRPAAGPVRVPLGGSAHLSARALTGDSTPVPLAPIAWEIGDSTIATLDPATGQVTAHALGTTSITARLGGFEPALWVVTVFPGDMVLDHPRLGLTAGERAPLAPRFADTTAGGAPPEGHFDWTTDRPGVATVTGEGAVTAVAPGHAIVTAWAPWGKTASADVFVTGDLLVSSNRAGRGFGIYQLRVTAPDSLLPVLTDTAANVQAVWSPDRSRIAFSSNRAGDYDIEVADADGGNRRVLSAGTGLDGEPAWSPDGTRLVFASARGGAAQLYSIGADGGDLRQLTTSPGASTSPAFSPDGRTIAFVSSRDGGFDIYLMDADGGNQRRITHTDTRELAPRFFPSGDLAWVVDRRPRDGSVIVRQTGASSLGTVVSAPAAILSWSVSRDGATIAYVTGRITSAAANRTAFSLVLQPVAGGPPVPVRLGPAEQPVTPAF